MTVYSYNVIIQSITQLYDPRKLFKIEIGLTHKRGWDEKEIQQLILQ